MPAGSVRRPRRQWWQRWQWRQWRKRSKRRQRRGRRQYRRGRRLVELLWGPRNNRYGATKRAFFSVYWENRSLLLEHYLVRVLLHHAARYATKSEAGGELVSVVRSAPDEPTLLRRVFRWFHTKTDGREACLERCPRSEDASPLEGGVGPDDRPPLRPPPRRRPEPDTLIITDDEAVRPAPSLSPGSTEGARLGAFVTQTLRRQGVRLRTSQNRREEVQ